MKKLVTSLVLSAFTVTLWSHFEQSQSCLQEQYDIPKKCNGCGKCHLPGLPCPK